ncbi:MAG: hypothetical protein GF388_03170 [Candidatus Aegiribacteria sp.]|nr:hypothetical protein [Candidatus Aegiribacteria sp.]MBD3294270.1 hypothetical protein [Candidatus Fermentibacteria bacterium]
MPSEKVSDSTVKLLKTISIILGTLFILAALTSNLTGLSISGGISRNQVLFTVVGSLLMAAGIMGRRFVSLYKGAGLLLVNLLVAFLIIEILSLVAVKVVASQRFGILKDKMEATGEPLEQIMNTSVNGKYAPYVVWCTDPDLEHNFISIGENGYRITPGNHHSDQPYKIFLFGGSAMWGMGVPDSATIASFLQQNMRDVTGKTVDVYNFGQSAFSSTQEVIELMLQLRQGNIPDAVVYYDGFNDVWGGYSNGFAGGHLSQEQIAARVEGTAGDSQVRTAAEILLQGTNLWFLITTLREQNRQNMEFDPEMFITYETMEVELDSLSEDLVHVYLGNGRVVEALARSYGFECCFIWQPAIWLGDKPLTDHEETVYNGGDDTFLACGDPAFIGLLRTTYGYYCDSIISMRNYHSFENIFDDVTHELYSDLTGVHVNGEANKLIAESIANIILEMEPDLLQVSDSLNTD